MYMYLNLKACNTGEVKVFCDATSTFVESLGCFEHVDNVFAIFVNPACLRIILVELTTTEILPFHWMCAFLEDCLDRLPRKPNKLWEPEDRTHSGLEPVFRVWVYERVNNTCKSKSWSKFTRWISRAQARCWRGIVCFFEAPRLYADVSGLLRSNTSGTDNLVLGVRFGLHGDLDTGK